MSRLFSNIRLSIVEHAVLSLNILVTIPFIRFLGPERYGVFAYFVSVAHMLSVLTFTYLEPLIIKELVHRRNILSLSASSAILNLVGVVFVFAVFNIYYLFQSDQLPVSLLVINMVAFSSISGLKNTFRIAFVSQQRLNVVAKLNIFMFVVSAGMKVVGILLGVGLEFFFFLMAFEALEGVILFGVAFRNYFSMKLKCSLRVTLRILKQGWPLFFTGISVLIFTRIDQVMIYNMLGEEASGQYASMMWIIEKFLIFISVMMAGLFPYLAEKYYSDIGQYYKAIRVCFKVFSLVVIPAIVFVYFWSLDIVDFILGDKFIDAHTVLAILFVSLIFIYWGALNQKSLVIENNLRLELFFASSSAVLNVILNLVLIPRFELFGAAVSTVVAHSVYFWIQILIPERRKYTLFMVKSAILPIMVSLLSVVLGVLFDVSLLFALPLFICVYGVIFVFIAHFGNSEDDYPTIKRLLLTKFIPNYG